MTVALSRRAYKVPLTRQPGETSLGVQRTLLSIMAEKATAAGTVELAASALADLTWMSIKSVHRAQRDLTAQGYLEQIAAGGGRTVSTWRVLV